MSVISKKILKTVLTILPVLAAVLAVVFLITQQPGPARNTQGEAVRSFRTIEALSVDLVPMATGYGIAKPGSVWEAVAEVKGVVASTHPHLKSGELISAGSILIQIDPSEYQLAVARLESSILETRAKLAELVEEEKSNRRLVDIEKRSLSLARNSFERKKDLARRKAISQDDVDREQRSFLLQKKAIQQLENLLALIPSRQKALESVLAVQESNLKQARIDLAKTTISAPFDCRLAEAEIRPGQFLRAGQSLFKAHGTAVAEVEARFRMEDLRTLLDEPVRKRFQLGMATGAFKRLFSQITVQVILQAGDWSVRWEARIDRMREAVDTITREMKLVVVVDRPYENAVAGVRPPLTAGMFCRVELHAPARPGSLVVPRSALHQNKVYLVDGQQRLREKPVVVDFIQADFAVIRSGLSAGDIVVASDPSPAILGIKVSPVRDDRLQQLLLAQSKGVRARP